MPWRDPAARDIFILSFMFAAAAASLRTLSQIIAQEEWPSTRDVIRGALEVFTIAFWGGLTGWSIAWAWPTVPKEMLGVICAALGWGGLRFTQYVLFEVIVPPLLKKAGAFDGAAINPHRPPPATADDQGTPQA